MVPRRVINKGNCYFCGGLFSKGGMKTHLLKKHGTNLTQGFKHLLVKIEAKYDPD
jgi:hypothetical protein